jgi:hypothetical protein
VSYKVLTINHHSFFPKSVEGGLFVMEKKCEILYFYGCAYEVYRLSGMWCFVYSVNIYWRFWGKCFCNIRRSFAEATRLNYAANQSMVIIKKRCVFCIVELNYQTLIRRTALYCQHIEHVFVNCPETRIWLRGCLVNCLV